MTQKVHRYESAKLLAGIAGGFIVPVVVACATPTTQGMGDGGFGALANWWARSKVFSGVFLVATCAHVAYRRRQGIASHPLLLGVMMGSGISLFLGLPNSRLIWQYFR